MKKHIIKRKNGHTVTFIGVNHEKSLENNEINNVIQGNDKILLEENTFLNHKQLMKKFSDLKVYEPTSINIYAKLNVKKQLNRISTWDYRPSYLGERQTGLYGADKNKKPFFPMHTMDQINEFYIKHIPHLKKKYKIFINDKNIIKNRKLNDLVKENKLQQNFVNKFHEDLRKDHAYIADDYTLKVVLPKYKNEDVTIIAGSSHHNYLIKNFKG
jgi:hypothetical protein